MKSKYTLPNMQHKIELQVKGEESGINWAGTFIYKRPSLQERAMIDVMRTRLSGDLVNIDEDTSYYNEAISHLRFTMKEYPEWWKDTGFGGELYDANVIVELYNKAMAFEADWRSKTFGKEEGVQDGVEEKVEPATPATEGPSA